MDVGRSFYRIWQSHSILCLFFATIVAPSLLGIYYMHARLKATLPEIQGIRHVAGIHAETRITRNEDGLVSITASNDIDAFFSLGYAHAQDRLWQLERQRRMAQGRLAEAFGKSAVGIDIYMRTLGLYRNAERSVSALSEASRQSLLAYSAGINAWLSEAHDLPVEFSLLAIQPDAWSPADSLAVVKLFALSLSGDFQQDLNRYLVAQNLQRNQYETLFGQMDVSLVAGSITPSESQQAHIAALANVDTETESVWRLGGKYVGSNAWVIAAKYSSNGLATLANDPHLGLDIPSLWYAVEINSPQLQVSGMSLVGLPIVMLGRNQHIAWGATNMMADTMDLYFEQLNPENNNQYRRGNDWKEFDSHFESIEVKADFPSSLREPLAPVQIKVRRTDKGPVLSDIVGGAQQPLSLSWVGDSAQDNSYDSFFQLNYAKDWNEVRLSMQQLISPALNIFYIDGKQNIGYLGVGKIPLRSSNHGMSPTPAWDADAGWQGFIPNDQMPHRYNPEAGYIVSANNRMIDEDYPYFISGDWAEPERAERIDQFLQQKIANSNSVSILDHQTLQLDQLDLGAMSLLSELIATPPKNDDMAQMLAYLRVWDGNASTDSIAASIFYSTIRHLRTNLLSDKLRSSWSNVSLKRRWNQIVTDMESKSIERALRDTYFNWCDRTDTSELETCDNVKQDALSDAARELTRLLGSDMKDWNWGRAHQAIFRHTPFSDVKGLDFLFERREPVGGSPNTVNLSAFSYNEKDGYVQVMGPAFRQIMQMSADSTPIQHWVINSTGQSGNMVSEHYDDMSRKFSAGKYEAWPSAWSAERTLTLKPSAIVN